MQYSELCGVTLTCVISIQNNHTLNTIHYPATIQTENSLKILLGESELYDLLISAATLNHVCFIFIVFN